MSGQSKAELQAMGFSPMPILRAVRAKCLDCSGGSAAEVSGCRVTACPLYPFRLGRNPWRPDVSPAQREASRRNAAALANPVKITGVGSPGDAAATSLSDDDGTRP
jgi:hypothetical protein